MVREILVWLKLVACLLLPMTGFSQAPVITDIQPRAALPGQTIDLILIGDHVADATDIWTSFPGEAHFVPDESNERDRVTCHMTLPRDTQVGVGGLRIANRSGVSSLQLFMIDDLRSVRALGGNTSLESAQLLLWPLAVDGRIEANQHLYFTFRAGRGQRVAIDVVAQRLGSQFDPVLRVLDATGGELAFVDDTPGVGSDCRLAFEAPADAEYAIELRDLRYRGGERAFFRLRVGDFPLATVPFPMGATPGRHATLTVAGLATRDVAPLEVEVPEDAPEGVLQLGVRFPHGRSSDSISLVVDSLADIMEVEPNDSLADSTPIDLPVAINGRLERPGDRDHYVFSAAKGQKLSILATTRSVGAPTDVLFALLDAEGKLVATADVDGADDGSPKHTIAKAGRYLLRVEGLNRDGGAEHAYRLKVELFKPHVALNVDSETINLSPGGELTLEVSCDRQDYPGPVALSIEGVGGDWELPFGVIEKGKASAKLKAVVPSSLSPGRCHLVRLVGEIEVNGTKTRAVVSTLPALRKLFPLTLHPPRALDGLIGIGVAEKSSP